MVQYSIRSIDVSSERTKSGLLISMVAEDLISEKNASSPTSKVSLTDYLINQEKVEKLPGMLRVAILDLQHLKPSPILLMLKNISGQIDFLKED